MKTFLSIIGVLVVLSFVVLIITESIDAGKSEVRHWAKEHNLEVESIQTHITQFNTPFFYLHKGCYIYEVKMTNGEKWWCRTGVFSNDWEKDKSKN